MKQVLVTGANKGIGLAIVEAILREQPDCAVVLGSRDSHRGEAARDRLLRQEPGWEARLQVLGLDVSDDGSVQRAAQALAQSPAGGDTPLNAIVNNAGIAEGTLAEVLNVNTRGIHRVCQAFLPLLAPRGRVVNVTSAAGPNYVAECGARWQAFFQDPECDWPRLEAFMAECLSLSPDEFAARGLGSGSPYGLSKACANLYTLSLARRCPQFIVSACTPGFIETDLTRNLLQSSGRSVRDAGLKQPADGARVVLQLLFDRLAQSGLYYGSDGLRSPLHRYRAPGSPAYTGD
jgi:NAD(P)-dependent dehydrogenase (short-subunit alcohol dehydrogenase family)